MMRVGEIKIEALKLMFANNGEQLTIDNSNNGENGSAILDLAEAAGDQQYADYLNNMDGAINRCFGVLEARKVVPARRHVLVESAEEYADEMEFDFPPQDSNEEDVPVDDVQRVTIRGSAHYVPSCDYVVEGDKLIVWNRVRPGDKVSMIYYPVVPRLPMTDGDDAEVPLPEKIASLIPYYVKFDLFREDDAAEANTALQMFERGVSELTAMQANHQTSVDNDLKWMV